MQTTLTQIFSAAHRGALIIGMDTVTEADLSGGKKNPMKGRVMKVMVGAVAMVNRDYEKSRNKQLQVAGFKPTFTQKPRRWGIYPMPSLPIITHNGGVYLNTSILSPGRVYYTLDNVKINPEDIIGLKESRGTGIAEAEVTKQLQDMTPEQIESIAAFKGLLKEGVENPDSLALSADILNAIQDSTKDLYPRDFKAVSITAIRVNKREYTNISATEA